jgi:aquaporin Z
MNLRAVIAEALGTFVLVLAGSMSIVSATGIGQGSGGVIILLVAPFGFGFGLLAAITLFGRVSGGHFNPAVTLAAVFDGRIDVLNAILYVIAQCVGAVAASFAILLILSKDIVDLTRNGPGVGDWQAFGAEVILTTILVGVIMTVTRRQSALAPLVISLTLVMIHFAAIPISGAGVNPARTLGPAIVVGNYSKVWIYLTAPMLGGLLGWGLYKLFSIDEDDELLLELEADEDLEAEIDDLPAR